MMQPVAVTLVVSKKRGEDLFGCTQQLCLNFIFEYPPYKILVALLCIRHHLIQYLQSTILTIAFAYEQKIREKVKLSLSWK